VKTHAAVLWEAPGEWDVVEVELADPREHEVLVRLVSAGLCHSEDHVARGDVQVGYYPYVGGHEGAGVVEAVGSGVRGLTVGDHVVAGFIPVCGSCRWCSRGMQHLCDYGRFMLQGSQLDGTYRMRYDGRDVAQGSLVSTFSQFSVWPEWSTIKIDESVSLGSAALLGCAVPTGWGSAVNSAEVRPGHVVIVMGVGGIGINAVQGARFAGASRVIAVDPVPFKRETALKLSATDAVESMPEAGELARSLTNGQGADSAILCASIVTGDHVNEGLAAIRKAGTVVVTGTGSRGEVNVPINLVQMTFYNKRIQGALFGQMSTHADIPFFVDLYRQGLLHLDELVTSRYSLDQVNEAYADLNAGRILRGVIDFA
jgi:NDMA-dependent alcohol dehydrogenase